MPTETYAALVRQVASGDERILATLELCDADNALHVPLVRARIVKLRALAALLDRLTPEAIDHLIDDLDSDVFTTRYIREEHVDTIAACAALAAGPDAEEGGG